MTPTELQNLRINYRKDYLIAFHPDSVSYEQQEYSKGRKFERLGLTLTKNGWTATAQFEGVTAFAQAKGPTIEAAIDAGIKKMGKYFEVAS